MNTVLFTGNPLNSTLLAYYVSYKLNVNFQEMMRGIGLLNLNRIISSVSWVLGPN
jgi:hypothetical protein